MTFPSLRARPSLTPKRRILYRAAGAALLLCLAPATAFAAPRVEAGISYVLVQDAASPRLQTLDLYLPAGPRRGMALLAMIQHELWQRAPRAVGGGFARPLAEAGVAVAIVRHRLAPRHPHPTQLEDLKAALALLREAAPQYGYDPDKIFLGGYFAGAHDAALMALVGKQKLAGAILFDGVFDLQDKYDAQKWRNLISPMFGTHDAALRAASPITHARADAPPLLVLSAGKGNGALRKEAARFVKRMRDAGHRETEYFAVADRNHDTLPQLGGSNNPVRALLLSFMGEGATDSTVTAQRRWQNPPHSTLPFWKYTTLIKPHPVDPAFLADLKTGLGSFAREELADLPLKQYHAIELATLLDTLPGDRVGRGAYLVVHNVRDEAYYLSREQIRTYRPRIVIGIDETRELFRFAAFYQTRRQYSWRPAPAPPMMARPLGAFIHFPNGAPLALTTTGIARFGLTLSGFHLQGTDPLVQVRELPPGLFEVMAWRNSCVSCHRFRGSGARAHHIRAADGQPHGAFALPLVDYPEPVWKRFVFSQKEAAATIGVVPNIVEENVRDGLYELIRRERSSK